MTRDEFLDFVRRGQAAQAAVDTMTKQHQRDPDIVIDSKGHQIPYDPREARKFVERQIDEGEILAVVLRAPTGDLAVQCYGPPNRELLDALEQAARGYRKALQRA